MSDLPVGWAKASVSDVAASMFDGPFGSALKTADYTESGVRVARLENIGHLRFRSELASYISEEKFGTLLRHTLRADDVLFSSFVDRQTRVCLVPAELDAGMINKADCFCIRVDRVACEPKFLAYYLASPTSYETFAGAVRGVTRPRIGLGDLASFEIGLPPPAEQLRIVAKLDALTARTARARADLDRIPTLAARYKQAVLVRAFVGALTADWRKGQGYPASWTQRRIADFATDIRYGTAAKCAFSPTETPVLRIPNVAKGRIDSSDLKHASFDSKEREKLQLQLGDLLVIRSNGSVNLVGRAAVATEAVVGFLYAGYLIRIRLDQRKVDPNFLQRALEEPSVRETIESLAKSTSGVNNINSEQLKSLTVPIPPLREQVEIVRRIDSAFAEIDRLAAEAASARKLVDRLDQAILAKAFRGELVPQDPADEPASALLDRIRAERVGAPKAERGRNPKAAA